MMPPVPQQELEHQARSVAGRLRQAGYRALWAGGCVRDRLLGRPFKDIDLATSARPDEVLALFPGSLPIGKAFGVVTVRSGPCQFDVATFRRDADYPDGRRPSAVTFSDEEEDARRRDFTVNGLFLDPADDGVLDYVGGREDLGRRVIRAIGDPALRFAEDHLRLARAVRFAAVLDFAFDPATLAAVRRHAALIRTVSSERLQVELTRLLTEAPKPGAGLLLLREAGLLREVLPEVEAMADQEQPPEFHPEGDVLTHTALMLDLAGEPRTPELMWSILLHDVGKPPTARIGPARGGGERLRFDGHDRVGARMARAILERLKMPARLVDRVEACVANHMRFLDAPRMRPATLRRFAGAPTFPLELELHRVDCLASHGDVSTLDFLKEKLEAWSKEPVLPPPLVGGRDVMALGIPEGPRIGAWLKSLYDRQLENPGWDRDRLLAWLKEMADRGDAPPD